MGANKPPFERLLFLRFGLVLWWLCALSCVWELLALQVPDSPYHAGVLPGPVGQLRSATFVLGTGALILCWLWPELYPQGRGRLVLGLLLVGAVLHVAALTYAASLGLIAVQLLDPREDARITSYARGLGHGFTWVGLTALVRRAFLGGADALNRPQ